MHSDRGFLEAIREQPDDDLNRLAWADWLEEQGDEDRATFVRAQVAAAHLDETDLAIDALEDRADDLLVVHDRAWAGRVGELALEWGWSRGCVESATFTAETLLEHGEELFEATPIRKVRLLTREDDLASLAECGWLRRIEHLEIGSPYLRDRALETFLGSARLDRLTSLGLRGHGFDGPLIESLIQTGLLTRLRRLDLSVNVHFGNQATRRLAEANAPNLEWIGLDSTNVSERGLEALASSKSHPRLREVQVNWALLFGRSHFNTGRLEREFLQTPIAGRLTSLTLSGLALNANSLETLILSPLASRLRQLSLRHGSLKGEADVGVIASSENLSGLRRLDLGTNSLRDKGARVLASSPFLTSLTHLNLVDNSIGGPGIRALLDSPILDRLRSLDLSGNHVGVPNVTALAKSQRPRLLRELRLRAANIDAECAAILARSAAFARLRDLGLGNNRFGDEGLEAIAKSPHFGRLQSIDLDGNEVDTNGVQSLLDTPSLQSLRRLSLRSNLRISPDERDRLAARFGAATRF